MSTAAVSLTHRDPRLDVLRGGALLLMAVDHVHGNLLAEFTPQKWGPSDMADAFVLLSGVVCGLAYSRRIDRLGWASAQRHALGRCMQIYIAYLFTAGALLTLELGWPRLTGELAPHVAGNLDPRTPPSALALDLLLWRKTAGNLTILPMYLLFLAATPGLVAIFRNRLAWLAAGSLTLYGAARFWPEMASLPEPYRAAWYFNPVAWQALFAAGLVLGLRRVRGDAPLVRSRRWRWCVVGLACVLVEGAFMWRLAGEGTLIAWSLKPNLAPLRIAHVACLGTLAWTLISTIPQPALARWCAPLAWCSRNPLTAYCAGVWLSAAGTLWLTTLGAGWLSQVGVNVVAGGGCLLAARLADCRSGGRQPKSDTAMSIPPAAGTAPS